MMLCAVSDSGTFRSCSVLRAFSSSTSAFGTFWASFSRAFFAAALSLALHVETGKPSLKSGGVDG
jgi:hypothetical protein